MTLSSFAELFEHYPDFDLVQSFLSQSPDDLMGEKGRLHERLSELFAMGELALSKGGWRLFMFKLRKAIEVMAQSLQPVEIKSPRLEKESRRQRRMLWRNFLQKWIL